MSAMCPRCYKVVDRPCQSETEVSDCSYMQRVAMHGLGQSGVDDWDVDTPHGLARAREWMERQVALIANGGSWIIPRSMSVIVIDKVHKKATRMMGMLPETSTRKVFEAMGWTWEDKA